MATDGVRGAQADPLWLPVPRQVRMAGTTVALPRCGRIAVSDPALLHSAACRLAAEARRASGAGWEVSAAQEPTPVVRVSVDDAHPMPPEGYRLTIGADGARVVAQARTGALHGLSTLTQLVRQYGSVLPAMEVEDAPDLPVRGLMLDVSRTKVPTMDTLKALVQRLAELKYNHLELYMEHTFAYRDHREVWEGASPFTGEEILALDAFCRDLGIDLVPNQNTLGHLTRWLVRQRYRALAECPQGSEFPWGRERPFSLAPALPGTLPFVASLLDELLPHFTSAFVNIGCDEAYDVGQGRSRALVEEKGKGRVLVDYMGAVADLARSRGRRTLFWADMVTWHHPEQIPRLPADAIACEWGYGAGHDWARYVAPLAEAGRPFYVCPGTSSWRSFTGRNEAGEANMRAAAEAARTFGAAGFLLTDWGDEGHMQPLPVSYWGYGFGAAMAWNKETPADLDAAVGLHLFGDPSGEAGRAVNAMGRIHARTLGERAEGAEDSFLTLGLYRPDLLAGLRERLKPGDLERVREEAGNADAAMALARFATADGDRVRRELRHAATAVGLAADLLGEDAPPARQLEAWRAWQEEFRALWLERFRPGGLQESLNFLAPARRHLGEDAGQG